MKEKFNLKKRIIIGLFLLGIMFIFYSIGYVNASWSTPEVIYNVENVGWFINDQSSVSSYNNRIFYTNTFNRWYIIYSHDTGTHDYLMKYAYSNSSDITAWNTGGTISTSYLRTIAHSHQSVDAQFAWVYDNENEIGHLAFAYDYSLGGTYGLFYKNFTIEESGSLTFGDTKDIHTQDSGNNNPSVDICLSQNNLPIIAYGGYTPLGLGYAEAHICDSTDGYNGNWEMVYFKPYSYSVVSIMPTGNESCILFAMDVEVTNPVRIYDIEFGVTSNSSGTGTSFSDSTLFRYDYQNDMDDILGFGISWNTTHGYVAYCDSSSDAQTFIFDFETLTKSDEYMYAQNQYWDYANGVTVQDNEPFVTSKYGYSFADYNQSIYGCEYHDSSYDGYFNSSATDFIYENYTSTWSDYNVKGINTAKTTDENGVSLIMLAVGDYVSVTWWTVDGEYSLPSPPPEEREDPFDWGNVKYMLAIIVFFIIAIFAIYIKKSVR